MKIQLSRLLAMAAAAMLGAAGNVYATNGSFMIGSGAGSIGMGGVGVTSPQDSMCVGGNPACLGAFERPQFDVGAGLFRPPRAAATTVMSGFNLPDGGKYVESEVNLYLLPSMGFVFPFNDLLTIGFAALPAGGGGVTFPANKGGGLNGNSFFGGPGTLGTDLVQLIVPITATFKLSPAHSVGVSIIPARQRFLAQGLQEFKAFSAYPDNLTNKGHDFANGLGGRVGWMGYFLDKRVTLGATYATKVSMGKLSQYKGLFPNQGSFDIPANYALGIGVKPIDDLTVALDVEKILYTGVPAFAHRGPDSSGQLNIDACTQGTVVCGGTSLGTADGASFGWRDQTVYKLGMAYKINDSWIVRAGYNYGKMPIQADQMLFSVMATATTEKHYTFGFTYSLGDQSIFGFGSEGLLTFAGMYAPNTKIEGNTVGTSGPVGLVGMQMKQSSWDIAYTLKF
jgi:long-chain fatty acid transport protein